MNNDTLDTSLKAIRESMNAISQQMQEYEAIRVAQNAATLELMGKLNDTVKEMEQNSLKTEGRLNALSAGVMELLGDRIDDKYNYYMALGYIPADEVHTFDNLYFAYAANGGNGKRAKKYQYVMDNLQHKEDRDELRQSTITPIGCNAVARRTCG
ncbi:MAG: hypothetical protein LUD12_16020 [Lachnospiraceae bacterium]|nr:hypothetical protein [Lachnospiraceae bacterium]